MTRIEGCQLRSGRPCASRAVAAWSTLGVSIAIGLLALALFPVAAAAGGRSAGAQTGLSFVSMYPNSSPTEIDRYALPSGRSLGMLAPVPSLPTTSRYSDVSDPHLLADGDYLITADHGADCASSRGTCHPIANTCASQIETLDPTTRGYTLRFAVSGAWEVYDAVPSPSGRSVALLEGGCTANTTQLVIRDLRTGRQQVVARDLSQCAFESSATWTRNGTRLVFAYTAHPNPNDPTGSCGLAFVSATRATPPARWPVIHPDKSYGFESAAYDATGLVATENSEATAETELIQYGSTARVLRRVSLGLGYTEATEVAYDPPARTVLVSEIDEDEPDDSTVWTFDDTRLHLVRYYFGADLLAEP